MLNFITRNNCVDCESDHGKYPNTGKSAAAGRFAVRSASPDTDVAATVDVPSATDGDGSAAKSRFAVRSATTSPVPVSTAFVVDDTDVGVVSRFQIRSPSPDVESAPPMSGRFSVRSPTPDAGAEGEAPKRDESDATGVSDDVSGKGASMASLASGAGATDATAAVIAAPSEPPPPVLDSSVLDFDNTPSRPRADSRFTVHDVISPGGSDEDEKDAEEAAVAAFLSPLSGRSRSRGTTVPLNGLRSIETASSARLASDVSTTNISSSSGIDDDDDGNASVFESVDCRSKSGESDGGRVGESDSGERHDGSVAVSRFAVRSPSPQASSGAVPFGEHDAVGGGEPHEPTHSRFAVRSPTPDATDATRARANTAVDNAGEMEAHQ